MWVGDVGADVRQQVEAHAPEVVEVAVLRQREGRAGEAERMHVLRPDALARLVDDAAHVRHQRRRAHLLRQRLEVAVEHRHAGGAVGVRLRRLGRRGVPGGQPEAAEVEQLHQVRIGRLPHERRVGQVEELVDQRPVTEVGQHPAHRRQAIERNVEHLGCRSPRDTCSPAGSKLAHACHTQVWSRNTRSSTLRARRRAKRRGGAIGLSTRSPGSPSGWSSSLPPSAETPVP